jgi:hypothetical protein
MQTLFDEFRRLKLSHNKNIEKHSKLINDGISLITSKNTLIQDMHDEGKDNNVANKEEGSSFMNRSFKVYDIK